MRVVSEPKTYNLRVYDGNRPVQSYSNVNTVITDDGGSLWISQADESGFTVRAKGYWSEVVAATNK